MAIEESPQPEIIRNLPQPPTLMCAGPAHMVVYARNKAMLAWGNQSCGRLGLLEKKMEKAPDRGPRVYIESINL